MKSDNDVVITGVGIVTCHGVGSQAHVALLSGTVAPATIVETEKFKPYPVHPMPEIDWSSSGRNWLSPGPRRSGSPVSC